MNNVGIIAPWYALERKIRGTYGQSEFVDVGTLVELSSGYLLNINVSLDSVAKALRAVLPQTYTISNSVVNVVIYDSKGNAVPVDDITYTAESLAQTVCNALYMNPLFVGTVITDQIAGNTDDLLGDVIALIKPEVIQFPNGSLGNICHTFSEVASEVFTEVSNLNFGADLTLVFNDYSKNCNIDNFYCTSNSRRPCEQKQNTPCGQKQEPPCWKKPETPCGQKQDPPCWKKTETPCGCNQKDNYEWFEEKEGRSRFDNIFGDGYNRCDFR